MFRTLRARFIALLALGFSLAVLAIGVLFFQYRTQIEHTEQLGQAAAVAAALDNLFADVLQASNTSRRFVLGTDPEQLAAYQSAVDSIPTDLQTIRDLTEDQPEFMEEFALLQDRLENKLAHLDAILALHSNAEILQMQTLLVGGDGLERLETFRSSVAAFRSIGYELADAKLRQVRIGVLIQVVLVTLMILCGIVWAAILGNEAIRNILMPISAMNAQIKRISSGDFRERLPVARRDEIGGLAEQINHMTSQLRTAETAREEAQQDLATERQNLIDALEALDEGFAAYDSDERLMQCNSKFLDYYPTLKGLAEPGVTYEALLRQKARTGAEPVAIGQEEAFVNERLQDTYVTNSVSECTLADGRVLQRSSYRTSYGGHVAVYVDITKIKEAEERLRELNRDLDARVQRRTQDLNHANEQLQFVNAELGAIILSAPVAIVVLSPERSVTTWNPASIELTGLEMDAVEPGLANVVDREHQADLKVFLDSVYDENNPAIGELRMRHVSGREIEARISASVLSDDQGQPVGAILIIADLTEARALRHQFEQSQKMEVVAKLTAGLAHDFNNLLAIVISNIEMLEKRIPNEARTHEMLNSAKRASLSGVALNKKLLAFSRESAPELEGLDIKQEFVFLEPLLQVTLGEGIELGFAVQDDVWPVLADRSLLQSAVLNLAVNARDAMDGDGRLDVTAQNIQISAGDPRTTLTGAFVEITLTDTGEGMSEDVINRAVQPFFTTKDFGKGSGLGLSMVYGFVKQFGGDIHIESQLGQGTEVSLLLPRADHVAATGESAQMAAGTIQGHDQNILVVEDNSEMRRALVLQLAELGFCPIQAEGGTTALELLEAEVPVDLLLTDIVMPGGIDGRELARQARELRPNLPIMFLSGYPATDDDGKEVSWESLGIRVLAKPIEQATLGFRINEALNGQGG